MKIKCPTRRLFGSLFQVLWKLVRITCHSAQATIQRLLTDPRIVPEDYLFWDGNPLQGPPENIDYVADSDTGLAYRETYAGICTKKGATIDANSAVF